MTQEEYIDDFEVARMTGKKVTTVRNWRTRNINYGPRFFKIGHTVRYRRSDIDKWLESCVVDPNKRGGEETAA